MFEDLNYYFLRLWGISSSTYELISTVKITEIQVGLGYDTFILSNQKQPLITMPVVHQIFRQSVSVATSFYCNFHKRLTYNIFMCVCVNINWEMPKARSTKSVLIQQFIEHMSGLTNDGRVIFFVNILINWYCNFYIIFIN